MSGQVRRDAHGIPHVVADSLTELARLQGLAVVDDRTWQVEHARLKAEGRTATVVGAAGLPWDRLARRAQVEELGRRAYVGLSEETRCFVDAFVSGVNEGLDAVGEVPELRAVGMAPGRWSAWTPLAVFAAHHLLFASFPTKLWRHHLRRTVGQEAAALFHDEGLWTSGSNSWVVGAGRTASGLPMVGGDPHRTFESPNAYQQVRLTCTASGDELDVVGFTFPGVPGVQHFAHAGRVAWGITNAMADYQDVFVERLERRGDEVWAEAPEGWVRAAVHHERIDVRDGEPETVEVVVTGNGPVVVGGPGEEDTFALRTASGVLGDVGFDSLLPLLRARSTADVLAALRHWVEPVNNVVVADVDGDVRQAVVGRVPDRAEENRWRPVPGRLAEHRWRGWVADLPTRTVPADGHLVTANHRMGEDFDRIGVEFAPPGRADRIDALLAGRSGLDLEAFEEIHRDVLAGQPAHLARAVALVEGLSAPAGALRAEIVAWDQRFTADSATAAAYAGVRDRLVERLAGTTPFATVSSGSPYGPVFDAWFHVPTQLYLSLANVFSEEGRRLLPDLDRHLAAALEDVAAGRPGRWGDRHRYRPLHALGLSLDRAPRLAGDNDCVRCTGTVPGSDTAVRGSVARYAWDLAGLHRSGWVVPLGASGDPSSPHHHDQTEAWVEGRLLPVAGTPG